MKTRKGKRNQVPSVTHRPPISGGGGGGGGGGGDGEGDSNDEEDDEEDDEQDDEQDWDEVVSASELYANRNDHAKHGLAITCTTSTGTGVNDGNSWLVEEYVNTMITVYEQS